MNIECDVESFLLTKILGSRDYKSFSEWYANNNRFNNNIVKFISNKKIHRYFFPSPVNYVRRECTLNMLMLSYYFLKAKQKT